MLVAYIVVLMMHGLTNIKRISINSFTVKITGYRRFRDRVAVHKPFAALGSHTHTHTHESLGMLPLTYQLLMQFSLFIGAWNQIVD